VRIFPHLASFAFPWVLHVVLQVVFSALSQSIVGVLFSDQGFIGPIGAGPVLRG